MKLHITEHGTHIVEDTDIPMCHEGCCWSSDVEVIDEVPGLTCAAGSILLIDSEDTECVTCTADIKRDARPWNHSHFQCGCPVWWNTDDSQHEILGF